MRSVLGIAFVWQCIRLAGGRACVGVSALASHYFCFCFWQSDLPGPASAGSISGFVTDSSGAVVSGASVVATDTQTGVKTTVTTDAKGFYSLPALPVGTYDLQVSQIGFKTYTETGLVINANSALRVDATLSVGTINEKIEVRTDAVHVETESTQMGEVITGKTMTAVPLNGRAYTDLLALQPGVSPYNAIDTGMAGINDRPVDGGLNSGNQSVNGQREAANGFMVNGSNVEEGKNNGAAIIPNLDSIAEFRIITNNFDAEYGNYSGGQINVVTKSGTNEFHGSGFEFLRNTALDAKNYYSLPTDKTPVFRQNQFGGTFGGPIRKDKTFFFVDYQGTRQNQAPTVNTQMPSVANFAGNFSGFGQFSNGCRQWASFCQSALPAIRLYGNRPRTVLHAGLHQCELCISRRGHPPERLVARCSEHAETRTYSATERA